MTSQNSGEDSSGALDIRALTWNVGSQGASDNAVTDFAERLKGGDVILVGTQEEQSKENRRLDTLLLDKLNGGLKEGEPKYVIVEHINDGRNWAGDGFKNQLKGKGVQQTRTTMIVREPYSFQSASVKQVKDKDNKRKSIGTIKGNLCDGSGRVIMPLSFSSGHLESYYESQRSKHMEDWASKSMPHEDSLDRLSFGDLVESAKMVSLFQGDLNCRDYSTADGKNIDPGHSMTLASLGFDIEKHAHELDGKKNIKANGVHGTYGVVHDKDGKQLISPELKRLAKLAEGKELSSKRAGVTKGGNLDRVAIATGRQVEDGTYEIIRGSREGDIKTKEKKGTVIDFVYGSDHAPVIRTMKVSAADSDVSIACNATIKRMPNIQKDIDTLENFMETLQLHGETAAMDSIRLYDQELNKVSLFKTALGIDVSGKSDLSTPEIKRIVQSRIDSLKKISEGFNEIRDDLIRVSSKDSIDHLDKELIMAAYKGFTEANQARVRTDNGGPYRAESYDDCLYAVKIYNLVAGNSSELRDDSNASFGETAEDESEIPIYGVYPEKGMSTEVDNPMHAEVYIYDIPEESLDEQYSGDGNKNDDEIELIRDLRAVVTSRDQVSIDLDDDPLADSYDYDAEFCVSEKRETMTNQVDTIKENDTETIKSRALREHNKDEEKPSLDSPESNKENMAPNGFRSQ